MYILNRTRPILEQALSNATAKCCEELNCKFRHEIYTFNNTEKETAKEINFEEQIMYHIEKKIHDCNTEDPVKREQIIESLNKSLGIDTMKDFSHQYKKAIENLTNPDKLGRLSISGEFAGTRYFISDEESIINDTPTEEPIIKRIISNEETDCDGVNHKPLKIEAKEYE
jgi:hypothetical protein